MQTNQQDNKQATCPTCGHTRKQASKKTYSIDVYRADLWGNNKDGFDWNDTWHIGIEEIETAQAELSEKTLLTVARNYFEGTPIALSENKTVGMSRRNISIEWTDSNEDEECWQIHWNARAVGELRVTKVA